MRAKIALSVFTVQKDWEAAPAITLQKIKEMGYDGVEFGLDMEESVFQSISAKLRELKLDAVSAHANFDDMVSKADFYFNRMNKIGMKYLGIPWLDEERIPGGSRYSHTIKTIASLAERCKAAGITLFYHNHDFEFKKINGVCKADILLKDIPTLSSQLDVCWCKVGGRNPAEYIRRYSGRIPLIHVKDYRVKNGLIEGKLYDLLGESTIEEAAAIREAKDFQFQPVGMGCVDFKSIFDTVDDAGVKWMCVEQDSSVDRPPMEAARLSLAYIHENYGIQP